MFPDPKIALLEIIREWVQRVSDPTAQLRSLERVTIGDLTTLVIAIQRVETKGDPNVPS